MGLHPELSFHASPPSSKPSLLLTSKRASARLRLSLGTDGGDTVEPPLPEELLLSDSTLSLPTTLQQKGAAWGLNWGLVKREADSEADAYYGYGGYGLGYGGYGYGGLG